MEHKRLRQERINRDKKLQKRELDDQYGVKRQMAAERPLKAQADLDERV